MTNYTVGSSIFCKLHLRVFDFLTFILQGPQFCRKYTLGLSKIGIFSYTLGLGGKAQHSEPPSLFIGSPPLGTRCCQQLFLIDDFYTFSHRQIFLSMTVLTQAVNRYVFCVVHEKKLLIINFRQCVFYFEAKTNRQQFSHNFSLTTLMSHGKVYCQ